jgi:hypothetical protein
MDTHSLNLLPPLTSHHSAPQDGPAAVPAPTSLLPRWFIQSNFYAVAKIGKLTVSRIKLSSFFPLSATTTEALNHLSLVATQKGFNFLEAGEALINLITAHCGLAASDAAKLKNLVAIANGSAPAKPSHLFCYECGSYLSTGLVSVQSCYFPDVANIHYCLDCYFALDESEEAPDSHVVVRSPDTIFTTVPTVQFLLEQAALFIRCYRLMTYLPGREELDQEALLAFSRALSDVDTELTTLRSDILRMADSAPSEDNS